MSSHWYCGTCSERIHDSETYCSRCNPERVREDIMEEVMNKCEQENQKLRASLDLACEALEKINNGTGSTSWTDQCLTRETLAKIRTQNE